MAKLILLGGPKPQEFEVAGEVTIGRQPDNTIQINEPKASRHHARVMVQGAEFLVEDMKSSNGTELNGQRITRQTLKHGDTIRIGVTCLQFDDPAPKPAAGALFAPTMIGGGQDPLFAPTMLGAGPAAAPASAPAAAAAKPAGKKVEAVPAAVAKSVPAVRIIQPKAAKRRQAVLAAAVLLLAAGGAWVMWPRQEQAHNIIGELKALHNQSKWQELYERCKQLETQNLSREDRRKVGEMKVLAEVELEAIEIRALIYEKQDFSEAVRRVQNDINKYPEQAEKIVELGVSAGAAQTILTYAERHKDPLTTFDPKRLNEAARDLRALKDKYTSYKSEMEKLSLIRAACQRSDPLLEKVLNRISDLDKATAAWQRVRDARQEEEWDLEVEALKELQACADEVVVSVANEHGKDLYQNASNFTTGRSAYQAGNYDLAVQHLGAVGKNDFHYKLAQADLEAIAKESDYREAVRLYRLGQAAEALAALKNSSTDKALKLRARIVEVSGLYENLSALQKRNAWDQLIQAGEQFVARLDKQFDIWYFEKGSALLKSARDQRVASLYYALEQALNAERYDDFMAQHRAFLQAVDKESYPNYHEKAQQLYQRAKDELLKRGAVWVRESRELWARYTADPIGPKERVTEVVISAAYRAKAELVREAYARADKARAAVELLPQAEKTEVLDLYEKLRSEVVQQCEKLFEVWNTYVRLGNFDQARSAKQKILMLPKVPENRWYEIIEAQKDETPK